MKYETKISRSIEEIDTKQWDNFADFCFMKSELLKIVENLEIGSKSYYLEIFDKKSIIAIAVFYGQTKTIYDNLEKSLFGKYYKFTKPFLTLNPSLLCYFPYSPFYKMFKIEEKYNKNELFELITQKLKSIALEEKYKSYGFLGIEDDDLSKETRFLMPIFSGFKIKIFTKGKNFDEHITKLSKSRRHTIKKDIKNFINSDYTVERIKKLGKYENNIFKIFEDNIEKYGGNKEEFKLYKEFLLALDKNSKKVTYFIGKLNGEIQSALVVIEDDSRVIGLKAGQLNSKEKQGFAFFNTVLYEPLIYSIEKLKKNLELGTGQYKYKVRRGAILNDSYNMIKSTSNFKNLYLKPIISILSKRNKIKHSSRLDVGGD
ncbi:MAG: peptidogalycan biosysnthesis protein [Candidatus Woesearchaeota archaeon]|jgi:predicted N-acyltransferase|nr:peptidogalycan biosysnthesis protein [Candidatus Woesearchaeota archaeon]